MSEGSSSGVDGSKAADDNIVYRTHFKFNAIYVLESLPDGELKTGASLFDDVIHPQKTASLEGAYIRFEQVTSRRKLLTVLSEIRKNARSANHKPIIHIEAHGSDAGIQLADGTIIDWRELALIFAEINEACQCNLTVVAISCKGWFLTTSLMPNDRAPVAFVIGPPGDMTAADLRAATEHFYSVLLSRLDFNEALAAMNNHADYGSWTIKPATAEVLFCRVFRAYVDEHSSQAASLARENTIVAELTKARQLDVIQSRRLRLSVRHDLADHEAHYNRLRERFLMLDLFPANKARFGLTYERCVSPQDPRVAEE